jgi:hypothetical protein
VVTSTCPFNSAKARASSVILMTTGTSCLSSADPSWLGVGSPPVSDYIQLSRGDSTEPFTGEDTGQFALPGSSKTVTCTSGLLNLPSSRD